MAEPRARFTFADVQMDRSSDDTAEAAVLIADGKVYVATDIAGAAGQWLELTRWLAEYMRPSALWQVVCRALRAGESAQRVDARANRRDLSTATAMLELAREVLGDDAYTKLRKAAADRMIGRG